MNFHNICHTKDNGETYVLLSSLTRSRNVPERIAKDCAPKLGRLVDLMHKGRRLVATTRAINKAQQAKQLANGVWTSSECVYDAEACEHVERVHVLDKVRTVRLEHLGVNTDAVVVCTPDALYLVVPDSFLGLAPSGRPAFLVMD